MAEETKKEPETEKEVEKVKETKVEKTEAKPVEKVVEKKETSKEAAKESGEKKSKKKSNVVIENASPAQVVKVFRKVGLYGECYQVLVRVIEGRDKGNLLRRNVRGPVKENDLLMLKETERDVRAV